MKLDVGSRLTEIMKDLGTGGNRTRQLVVSSARIGLHKSLNTNMATSRLSKELLQVHLILNIKRKIELQFQYQKCNTINWAIP